MSTVKKSYVVKGDGYRSLGIEVYSADNPILALYSDEEIHPTFEIAKIESLKILDAEKLKISKLIKEVEGLNADNCLEQNYIRRK